MSAPSSEQLDTKSSWLWPSLLIAIAIIAASAMVFSQKFVQKVDNIEKQQAAQYAARESLLLQPDVININWMRTLDPMAKKIRGDIVWSTLMQKGIMRFANLPKLTSSETYHLWMYDLASSASEAVSVVKFSPELTMPTELLVSFKPPITVSEPYKFTIMLDKATENTPPHPLLLAQP